METDKTDIMPKHKTKIRYMVSIYDDPEVGGALRFTFVPAGTNDKVRLGQLRQPIPAYILTVAGYGERTSFTWLEKPEKAAVKTKLEAIREAEAMPLSKASLKGILDEMSKDAG